MEQIYEYFDPREQEFFGVATKPDRLIIGESSYPRWGFGTHLPRDEVAKLHVALGKWLVAHPAAK